MVHHNLCVDALSSFIAACYKLDEVFCATHFDAFGVEGYQLENGQNGLYRLKRIFYSACSGKDEPKASQNPY